MNRAAITAAAVAALTLAACGPDSDAPPQDDPRPDPIEGMAEDEDPEPEPDSEPGAPEPVADDALAHFNDNYAGRWGMTPDCHPEGVFTLSAEQFALYEIACEVLSLGRDGEMSYARATCVAEGEPLPDRTITIRASGPDQITVEDGHYDWVRHRCALD